MTSRGVYSIQSGMAVRGSVQSSAGDSTELPFNVRLARPLIFIVLLLTAVLSYGGENLTLGGLRIPFAWILITVVSLLIGRQGVAILRRCYPFLFAVWLLMLCGGIIRLLVDIPHYGLWALRDSIFFAGSVGLPFGLVSGWHFRKHRWQRLVTTPVVLSVIYGLSYPWKDALAAVSPQSGVFVQVPLLGSYSNIVVFMAALWGGLLGGWGLNPWSLLLAVAMLVEMAWLQGRLAYMAVPLAGVVTFLVLWRAGRIRLSTGRVLLLGGIIGFFFCVTILVPIPGRLGSFDPEFLGAHLGTIVGMEGPAYGPMAHRYREYPIAIRNLFSQPWSALLAGNGLGSPITLGVSLIYTRKLHLDFVETIYRGGLVGMLWVITVLTTTGAVLSASSRWIRQNAFEREGQAVLLMVCSLVVFSVVMSCFEPLFFWAYGAFPYYFYGGLVLGIAGKLREECRERDHGESS